jgi:hypothetical protein
MQSGSIKFNSQGDSSVQQSCDEGSHETVSASQLSSLNGGAVEELDENGWAAPCACVTGLLLKPIPKHDER